MNKQIKTGIIVTVLIVLGFAGSALYKEQKYKSNIINEKNSDLTEADQQAYKDRLSVAEKALTEAETNQQKYNQLINKGFQLYGLGRLKDAREVFETAVKLDVKDHAGYMALYLAQADMNDTRAARDSIKTAINLKPDDSDIWKKYIQLEIDKFSGQPHDIKPIFADALNNTATGANSIDMITFYASYLEKIGDLQGSKEYWQKAIEKYPDGKVSYEMQINKLDAQIQRQNVQ